MHVCGGACVCFMLRPDEELFKEEERFGRLQWVQNISGSDQRVVWITEVPVRAAAGGGRK